MIIPVCVAIATLAGVYVLVPLFKEPAGGPETDVWAETEIDRLLGRKATVFRNLKELEFDYEMGRLSDADFKRLQASYKAEAALVLQKLDQFGAEEDVDESIEREVATRKAAIPRSSPSTCPSCGARLTPGKRFCGDCGQRL